MNWLVEVHSENLSAKDEKALFDRFYDEERFIREALKEVQLARSEGRELTLKMILGASEPKPTSRRKKPRISDSSKKFEADVTGECGDVEFEK